MFLVIVCEESDENEKVKKHSGTRILCRVRRATLDYLRERRGKSARIVEQTNYRAPSAGNDA